MTIIYLVTAVLCEPCIIQRELRTKYVERQPKNFAKIRDVAALKQRWFHRVMIAQKTSFVLQPRGHELMDVVSSG